MQSRSLWATGLLACAACSAALDWREVRPEGSDIVALFPCKPASHARQLSLSGVPVRTTLYACSTGGATWAVSFADVQDPARVAPALVALRHAAAGNVGAATGQSLDLRVAGATPNPESGRSTWDGRYPDGRAMRMQSAVFARGTVVYQATVLGERLDAEALDTFYASLRFPS
jgi:hypothetical protein